MMTPFTYHIREARNIIRDPEGFWTPFGSWLDFDEVHRLNEQVLDGKASVITDNGQGDQLLITFGGGHHYEVEATTHCPGCGDSITIAEGDIETGVHDWAPCRRAVAEMADADR